jgi:hypothetical protein
MIAKLIKRVKVEQETRGKTYEEANWAKLSPAFRKAHNILRKSKGLEPIPAPKIDLYVPPKMRKLSATDMNTPEAKQVVREFLGTTMGPRGHEGFTIGGNPGDAMINHMLRKSNA